jgi:hypothetical protein
MAKQRDKGSGRRSQAKPEWSCETSSNINAHFFPRGEIRHRREKSVLIIGTGIREGASIFKIWVQPQT